MKAPVIHRARRKTSASKRSFFSRSASTTSFFFAQGPAVPQHNEGTFTPESRAKGDNSYHVAEGDRARSSSEEILALAGRGESLPPTVRRFFEAKLSSELGSVRIHHGPESAGFAELRQAQGYAMGNDIVFNAGKYDPYSDAGRRLLSHELAHVVQQRENPRSFGQVRCMPKDGSPEAHAEKEKPAAAKPSQDETAPAGAQVAREEKAAAVRDEKAAANKEEKVAAPMPLPNFSVFGKPSFHSDFAQNVTFSGRTDASFDGGKGHTENLRALPATDCKGCGAGDCITVTGSLVINYHVSTTVSLPEVPSGLTPCQQKRVRDTINNVLKPHEDQHVAAFESYNGVVKLPINYTGCKDGLQAHVQAMIDSNSAAREAAAKAKSAALDPFVAVVDLDCEEPPKK